MPIHTTPQPHVSAYHISARVPFVYFGNVFNRIMLSDTILEGLEEDKCLTALFWTNPRDDREKLIQTKGPRVDGTCEWIKTNELYSSWLHSHSQLLWLSGGPGKGKTMLSIFLAEELERTAKHSRDTMFLQYFCDNKDERRNTAVAIIRGLIFQLLQLRPKLFNHILPSFKIQKESLFTNSSFETLWRIFETMLRDLVSSAVYCILDGLDECDEASLEVLLKKFRALFTTKFGESPACHLNLIVVSRDHPDFIPEILSNFSRIRLDPDADKEVNNDVHRFIEVKINDLSIHREYPEPLRVRVEKVFQDRAQGAFLWVGIVAQELRRYKATEVEKALDLFPAGLEELYARMLLQIDLNRRETAARILLWVVMAIRPLTLSELSVVINVKPSVGFSRDEVMRDQVSYCGYFLTIKEDEVGLIHQSAKDYLLRKSLDPNPELENFRVKEYMGNLKIARKCLDYLQSGALANGKVDLQTDFSHLKVFPLLSYAALHWPEHARSLARSEDIFDLSLPFYHKTSQIRLSWLRTYWAMKEYDDLPKSFTLLHLASYFGILPLAENLLLKKGLINKVKRLLVLGLNKIDDKRSTTLYWAAQRGHEAVVRLLLEKGADVEAKGRFRETALIGAARGGHEAVVRLLLEKGADVEAKDEYGGTALVGAAEGGHEAVVRLLLEKGADVEVKDGLGGTALIGAAQRGHEAVVRLLLEKGADVKAKDKYGGTALIGAAKGGHEAVVQLLTPFNLNS
jgi:hypothetical protein